MQIKIFSYLYFSEKVVQVLLRELLRAVRHLFLAVYHISLQVFSLIRYHQFLQTHLPLLLLLQVLPHQVQFPLLLLQLILHLQHLLFLQLLHVVFLQCLLLHLHNLLLLLPQLLEVVVFLSLVEVLTKMVGFFEERFSLQLLHHP